MKNAPFDLDTKSGSSAKLSGTNWRSMLRDLLASSQQRKLPVQADAPVVTGRRIVHITGGHGSGSIKRLVSPTDFGHLLKPFVFLDQGTLSASGKPVFGIHPHSGIATLTVVLSGKLAYSDTTGKSGEVSAGGVEWMKAGAGVWHDGWAVQGDPLQFFQLWLALPAAEENAASESRYVRPEDIQEEGGVRVILGQYGKARSRIHTHQGINYFVVRLRDGQRWKYEPPAGHNVAWAAVQHGLLLTAGSKVVSGELVVFEESNAVIEFEARGDTTFVLGSAVKHPHELVLGRYSVHTSAQALQQGEAEIRRIGHQLQSEGRLP